MKNYFLGLALIGSCLMVSISLADKNEVIRLGKRGHLEGIPKVFQPAKFNKKSMTVTIKNRKLRFPPCLRAMLPKNNYDLDIGGAWYHESTGVPPYIHFVYKFKKGPGDPGTEIWLVFALDTLEMLSAEIATMKESIWTHRELNIDHNCRTAIARASIRP